VRTVRKFLFRKKPSTLCSELPERLALNSFAHFPSEKHDRHAIRRHYSILLNLDLLPNIVAFWDAGSAKHVPRANWIALNQKRIDLRKEFSNGMLYVTGVNT
jgi:hypothetical protein